MLDPAQIFKSTNPDNNVIKATEAYTQEVGEFDTDSFVIYRSEVYGKGQFGIPKELVRIIVGYSASEAVRHDNNLSPVILSLELNNLPKPRDIHRIIALKKSDLGANGTFQFTWDHYDGDGLAGYNIYTAESGNLSEEALHNMTKQEIIEEFNWSLQKKYENQSIFA